MNSTTYLTPFWIQDVSGSSWTLYLYARNSGSTHGALDWTIDVEYSTDGSTWSDFGTTPTARNSNINKSFSANQKVYLRSKTQCTHWGKYDTSNNRFWFIQILSSQHYSVGGNIMSLIYGSTFTTNRNYTTFPDDTLKGIFFGLFYSGGSTNNTNLIDASELVLPVTHSTSTVPSAFSQDAPLNRCYASMFNRCTSLVGGPFISIRPRGAYDLPYCLQTMFNYCTNLQSVSTCLSGGAYRYDSCFGNGGGAQGGTFYNYSGYYLASISPRMTNIDVISMYLPTYDRVVDWHLDYSGYVIKVTDTNNTRVIWEKMSELYEPFYVENTTNSAKTLTISQKHQGSSAPANNITIEYSTNKTSWTTLGVTSSDLTYSVPANSKLYLRSQSNALCLFDSSYRTYHTITGIPKVGGNILSLMYGSNFAGQNTFPTNAAYCLGYLFMNNTTLTNASSLLLPCDILNEGCYAAMFYGCTALSNAPKLPATTLAAHCYNSMFKQCSSLITSPDLLATNLVDSCYYQMFSGCTNLRNVKCLGYNPDTTAYYTQLWLLDVYSTGTFIKASNAVWPRDASGIPSGWTVVNQ